MVSAFDPNRAADTSLLNERLDNLRLALGADRLALARRLSSLAEHRGAGPFEVLARVGSAPPSGAAVDVPVEIVHRLMTEARPLDVARGLDSTLTRVLETWDAHRLLGWPLPRDRRPSIFAVALFRQGRDPGPVRIRTALTGLEALARALAPPDWLPLAQPHSSGNGRPGPGCALLRGSSAVAIELRREVESLRMHAGVMLAEGPPGSGRIDLARTVLDDEDSAASVEVCELLSRPAGAVGARVVLGLEDLGSAEQTRLKRRLSSPHDSSPRWVFLATDELRSRVEAGRFRSDLYWELASRRLVTGPLHERREDIAAIFGQLWLEATGAELELDRRVAECLRQAPWPGHYQQLRAEVDRISSRHPRARVLRRRWLSPQVRRWADGPEGPESLNEALQRFERDLLQRALRVAEGNKTLAARRLQVSRQGLYRKLKQHGLIPVD